MDGSSIHATKSVYPVFANIIDASTLLYDPESSDNPFQPIHSFWRTFRGADFRGTGRLSLILVGIWHIICAHYRKDDCRRRQPIKFP